MMCPFCGKEMDEGFVKGLPGRSSFRKGGLYWDTKAKMKVSDFFHSTFQALALSHYDAFILLLSHINAIPVKKL